MLNEHLENLIKAEIYVKIMLNTKGTELILEAKHIHGLPSLETLL
jgi:hypothetical protein